ncbi:MAG: nucleotide sugar dehydrogenase [Spartobacteria bacterium]|nr:nucleotide sugar dehydrogenase [Spartobacteria bacterium]
MNVGVFGLWHLGCVTTACLVQRGHSVIGFDPDSSVVDNLSKGVPPIAEPGLGDALFAGLESGRLRFSDDITEMAALDILWITFDTPVDEQDQADVDYVIGQITTAMPSLTPGTPVLISSQLPVGSVAKLEKLSRDAGYQMDFACSPENLRLGQALDVFLNPDRIVVGVRTEETRRKLERLLLPVTDRIVWVLPESAEMAKHAINSFLAMSIAFTNEIACLCERTGADAKEVEMALKTEKRIGKGAYVSPGQAFAGGTLARDLAFLCGEGTQRGVETHLIHAVIQSNNHHKSWIQRKIADLLAGQPDARLAVWGLTYKPGTDTLRRSASVALCRQLQANGWKVQVHDPAFQSLPCELEGVAAFYTDPVEACTHCDALIVATPWPCYLDVASYDVEAAMSGKTVIDAARFLDATLGKSDALTYIAIGRYT